MASVSDQRISRYATREILTSEGATMRGLLSIIMAASAVATPVVITGPASAAAPCAPGYVQSGLICIPGDTAAVPAAPAPAPILGIVQRPIDNGVSQNLVPLIPVQPAQPATPAPAPPNQSGGNATGSPGLIGPVGVGPVLPQGTCSPMVGIVILGTSQTCRPPTAVVVSPQPAPSTVIVQPAPAPRIVQQYSLPVTH